MDTTEAAKQNRGTRDDHHHVVHVTVDGTEKDVRPGDYLVSTFKEVLGVPADKVLDQVINGQFVALADTAHVKIKGGEQFVSQGHGGGSS